MEPLAVRDVVREAFLELHGCGHSEALRKHGIVECGHMWRRAERLARRRVGTDAWSLYRDFMARDKAKSASRAANGNTGNFETSRLATEPAMLVRFRTPGRSARRGAGRSTP